MPKVCRGFRMAVRTLAFAGARIDSGSIVPLHGLLREQDHAKVKWSTHFGGMDSLPVFRTLVSAERLEWKRLPRSTQMPETSASRRAKHRVVEPRRSSPVRRCTSWGAMSVLRLCSASEGFVVHVCVSGVAFAVLAGAVWESCG